MDKVKLLEGLKKIKEAFISVQKFVDAKLNDGTTIIRYDGDSLQIGTAVLVVTDQGAIAIPDGEYTLEDGTAFTITGGIVAEVSTAGEEKQDAAETGAGAPAAAGAPPAKPAAMTEANAKAIVESIIKETRFAEEIAELKSQINEFKTEKETFATQKTENEKEITELKDQLIKTKETITSLFALVEKIAELPSAAPAEPKKEKFDVSEFRKNFKNSLEEIKQTN